MLTKIKDHIDSTKVTVKRVVDLLAGRVGATNLAKSLLFRNYMHLNERKRRQFVRLTLIKVFFL